MEEKKYTVLYRENNIIGVDCCYLLKGDKTYDGDLIVSDQQMVYNKEFGCHFIYCIENV